jgi:hypothetical protein
MLPDEVSGEKKKSNANADRQQSSPQRNRIMHETRAVMKPSNRLAPAAE